MKEERIAVLAFLSAVVALHCFLGVSVCGMGG